MASAEGPWKVGEGAEAPSGMLTETYLCVMRGLEGMSGTAGRTLDESSTRAGQSRSPYTGIRGSGKVHRDLHWRPVGWGGTPVGSSRGVREKTCRRALARRLLTPRSRGCLELRRARNLRERQRTPPCVRAVRVEGQVACCGDIKWEKSGKTGGFAAAGHKTRAD